MQTNELHCGACFRPCPTGNCVDGKCQCNTGETWCLKESYIGTYTATCTDTETDPENCGYCGNFCEGENAFCLYGECACLNGVYCGEECCSGYCINNQCIL